MTWNTQIILIFLAIILLALTGCDRAPACRVYSISTFSRGVMCEQTVLKFAKDQR